MMKFTLPRSLRRYMAALEIDLNDAAVLASVIRKIQEVMVGVLYVI